MDLALTRSMLPSERGLVDPLPWIWTVSSSLKQRQPHVALPESAVRVCSLEDELADATAILNALPDGGLLGESLCTQHGRNISEFRKI